MKIFFKDLKDKRHTRKIVGLGFGFALLISGFSSYISYNSTDQVLNAANDLSHSHVVHGLLKEIISDIAFAESCERGYVLTAKEEYYNYCNTSSLMIKRKVSKLRDLTGEGSHQRMRLDLLEPMIDTRFSLMDEIVEARRNKGYDAALELVLSHRPKIMITSIRNIIGYMEKEEQELLTGGTVKAKIYSDRIKSIIVLGNIITFVVLTSSLVILFIDISQRNYFEKELIKAKEIAEKSVKVKEHFLANISHEIRTPMNAISGLTRILLRTKTDAKQKEYLDAIKASSDMLLVIINDILDLSKAQAGKMVFEKTEFRLSTLISSITDLLHSRAEEKNLKLHAHFDGRIPDVLVGDPVRLNQIILNLVSNAIKFTEKGAINMSVEVIGKSRNTVKLRFTVKDTGIGIPEDILPSIFESFTQASTETTRKYGGTGLGLNIVKELIELQGGMITVQSKVNEGSVFSFMLDFPVAGHQDLREKNPVASIKKRKLPKAKVLLVEDNVINQLVAQTVLKEFGFITETADNGREALEKLNSRSFDIVLMDIQMPEMSGYDVTRLIRKTFPEPLSKIPIIAMTANAGKEDEEKCLKAGMNDFVSKPFDEDDLLKKIIGLLNKVPGSGNATPVVCGTPVKLEKPVPQGRIDHLKKVSNGNNQFLIEIIQLFLSQTPQAIANIKTHYREKNWKLMTAEAHKMKPSLGLMGEKELEKIAKGIEESSTNTEMEAGNLKDLVLKLEEGCNILISELEQELININNNKNITV